LDHTACFVIPSFVLSSNVDNATFGTISEHTNILRTTDMRFNIYASDSKIFLHEFPCKGWSLREIQLDEANRGSRLKLADHSK